MLIVFYKYLYCLSFITCTEIRNTVYYCWKISQYVLVYVFYIWLTNCNKFINLFLQEMFIY